MWALLIILSLLVVGIGMTVWLTLPQAGEREEREDMDGLKAEAAEEEARKAEEEEARKAEEEEARALADEEARALAEAPSPADALTESSVIPTVLIRDPLRVNDVSDANRLLTTLTLPRFYALSYEMYVHGTTPRWGEIVRFNNTNSTSHNFPRPIAHFLRPGETKMHAKAATNGDRNRGPDTRALPLEQWTRVRIDILPSDSVDHVYRISLNGETVHEESSSVPNLHGLMWVWVGGDSNNGAHQPANVTVKNMILQPHA
jgi:hypothetical protein